MIEVQVSCNWLKRWKKLTIQNSWNQPFFSTGFFTSSSSSSLEDSSSDEDSSFLAGVFFAGAAAGLAARRKKWFNLTKLRNVQRSAFMQQNTFFDKKKETPFPCLKLQASRFYSNFTLQCLQKRNDDKLFYRQQELLHRWMILLQMKIPPS